MMFETTKLKPHLPYNVPFQINVVYEKRVIGRIVIEEGASMCATSLSYWKAIVSLELTPSPTLLTAFEGLSLRPHKIISSFLV